MTDLQAAYRDDRVVIVTNHRVIAAGWTDAPTAKQMKAMEDLTRAHQPTVDDGCVLSNVIYAGTPRFSDPVRKDAARLTADPDLFVLGRAHVVLFGGMKGAAVRAFLGTMMVLGRPPRPTKVFGSLEDARRWLAGHVRDGVGEDASDELATTHAWLERQVQSRL